MANSCFNPFPILATERMVLRQLVPDDLAAIFALRSNPEVNQHIKRPPPENIGEAEAFIEKISRGIAEEILLFWVITPKESSELIGSICLWNFSEDKRTAELGYDLLPDYHRRGIMNESMKAVLEFGLEKLKLDRIEAYTHLGNQGSVKLLERNGFVLDADRRDEDDDDNRIFVFGADVSGAESD